MTIEEKLKDLILIRYHSIRDFTTSIDLPYTTLDSMFRRGIDNSSVSNVMKVCKALEISVDALANGEIAPLKRRTVVQNSIFTNTEVEDIVEDVKEILTTKGGITVDGKPMAVNTVDFVVDSMDMIVEMAKRKNEDYNKK